MAAPNVNTSEHRELLSLVRRRLRSSENAMSVRHRHWRKTERTYRLYVDPDEVQEPVEAITDEAELLYTYPTSIVVPLSYAIAQTLISFWVTIFTSEKPYMRVDYRDLDSKNAARAQELLLDYQLSYTGYVPFLYYWILDSLRYGAGIASNAWDVIERNQTTRRFIELPGLVEPIKLQIKERRSVLEYEGNVPEVIDPFTWRPDHRWPVSQFQKGSFCGESIYRSYEELRRRERQGVYTNVDEIQERTQEYFKDSQSDRDRVMETNRFFGLSFDDPEDGLVLIEQIQMNIIPKKYKLSDSEDIEKWLLTTANRSVVLRADPFPFDHNDYTYAVIETSPDTHSLMNPGILEIMEPVHQHITWFINTMIENARKSLNDRLVVDPDVINMDDLLNPSAGKYIRINESYWGIPGAVKNGLNQLSVEDIASQNFKHVGFLMDLLERVSAATETIQGKIEDEGRTATEVSSAAQQGAVRLRMMARMMSSQGHVPLARQMAQNNMQFMSQETYLNIVGPLEEEYQGIGRAVSGGGIMISPEDIQGLFTFPVSDASAPLDPVRFARTWVQIMQISTAHPILTQRIDHVRTWLEMIKSMGIPDPQKLLLPQVQVMPDEQLVGQVQAGNLIEAQNPASRAPIPNEQEMQSIEAEEERPL